MRPNTFILVTIALLTFNCVEAQRESAFALRGSKWQTNTIEVTWENPSQQNLQEREWVKQAITNTWQAVADVNFTNWGKSNNNSRGIRIRIRDEGPHVKLLGNQIDGMEEGMVLNFTFNNWSPSMKNRRKDFIVAIAVHEFGHALGFAHEHNRTDCYFCDEKKQGTNGDYWITTCDLQSVMNYCNPDYGNWGKLSESDVIGVVTLYGRRQTTQPTVSYYDRNVSLAHISRDMTREEKQEWPSLHKFIQIYVTGSDKAMNSIEKVVYELHPTFEDRFREVDDKESNFGYGIYVWGMFELRAAISFKDGSTKNLRRYLRFEETPQSPSKSEAISIKQSVQVLSEQESSDANGNTREVKLYIDASDTFLENVSYVQYTLHSTFNPRVRTSNNKASKFQLKFTCWGQFTVYGKVVMRDGTAYNLEHTIKF